MILMTNGCATLITAVIHQFVCISFHRMLNTGLRVKCNYSKPILGNNHILISNSFESEMSNDLLFWVQAYVLLFCIVASHSCTVVALFKSGRY